LARELAQQHRERISMLELIERVQGGTGAQVRVYGEWTFESMRQHEAELKAKAGLLEGRPPGSVAWDLEGVESMDDAGAVWLAGQMGGLEHARVPDRFRRLLEQVVHALAIRKAERRRYDVLAPVLGLGQAGIYFFGHIRDGVALLGQLLIDSLRFVRKPAEIPLFEISANIYRTGVTALPVTMLVGFLVGVVLTYLSALQLKSFGADLLVINIVAIGVVRELGPMLASIISAGRSGSTMTAQLGVMRVTEEIEALAVMGISVTNRLVVPKVVGLAIALPLVTFATDIAALAGGMLVAKAVLGIEYAAFVTALPRVLDVTNFWIGILKSIAFGFAVAFVACHYGLRILPNTDSLGAGVTKSVVASITSVILLDAIFAILLRDIPK
jgi:phospholipid/cholesterol/gamma-HCH transport system permease protein